MNLSGTHFYLQYRMLKHQNERKLHLLKWQNPNKTLYDTKLSDTRLNEKKN